MNGNRSFSAYVRATALTAALGLLLGCESVETNQTAIAVTPASTTLAEGRGTVVLTAAPANTNAVPKLYLPLVWTVSNPALGRIEATGGAGAVYIGNGGAGANPIVVRDQRNREGVAVVYHGD